jgi:toxin secretion/phage lysis holin
METGLYWLRLVGAAIGGFLGWYLGGADSFLYALLVFVAIDYLTGVMCAVQDRKLSSKIGYKGIFKKVTMFLLVGIAHMIDSQIIGHDSVFRSVVIFFYIANEGISILENAVHLGLPVPERLRAILLGMYGDKEQSMEEKLEREVRRWQDDE